MDRTVSQDNLKRNNQLRNLQKIPLTIGKAHVKVWVMDTNDKREEGMMYLTDREVKADEGMLFVFSGPQPLSFWMENTILPLDLIFVADDKTVLNVLQGKPFDKSPLPSRGRAQYVVELKAGTSKKLGIKDGDAVSIPDGIRAKN